MEKLLKCGKVECVFFVSSRPFVLFYKKHEFEKVTLFSSNKVVVKVDVPLTIQGQYRDSTGTVQGQYRNSTGTVQEQYNTVLRTMLGTIL